MSPFAALLEPICHIAFEAGEIALEERKNLQRELKPDGSIVTSADRAVETYLREALPQLVAANVWGEEFGFEPENESGLWAVDPVDGTSNFTFGSALWGISIALLRHGDVRAGCVILPDLNEIYLSAEGHGVFLNGEPLPPIPAGAVQREELVSYNDTIARNLKESKIPGRRRDLGAFVVSGTFVATQRFRGLIGKNEKLYDCAPCILFARELGADVRYADGSEFTCGDLICDVKIGKPWIIFPAESGFRSIPAKS